MFFGNPDLLERNLHTDLNTVIKNVKIREDQHLCILQYNKTLIEQQKELDSIAFINEQIVKHKNYYHNAAQLHQEVKEEQVQMIDKYACVASSDQNILKLMSRVSARILEVCQSSLEKIKHLDEAIIPKHHQMKTNLMKLLNERGKIDVQNLLEIIILYGQLKHIEQIQKLEKIISIIEEGDCSQLNSVYVPYCKKVQPRKPSISTQKRVVKNSTDKMKERQRREKLKEEALNAEKQKKKKSKNAHKMLTNLYSTMELSRNHFLDDMIFNNVEDKKKKLYEEIFSRNKLNYEQILTFQAKRSEFQEKVRSFQQMMKKESIKIEQRIQNAKPDAQKKEKESTQKEQNFLPISIKKPTAKSEAAQSDNECEIIMPQKERLFRRREMKIVQKIPSPSLTKQVHSSIQSTQEGFQHLKFDMKNQQIFTRSNRARLPHIAGRSSFDNRYAVKKQKPKEEKRINIAKHIDIGMPVSRSGKKPPHRSKNASEQRKQIPFQENDSFDKALNLQSFEQTFYARRKTNKFYETRNNFLF